jgi:hypothetical protein
MLPCDYWEIAMTRNIEKQYHRIFSGIFFIVILVCLSFGASPVTRATNLSGLTSTCGLLSVDSGVANGGLSLNGFLNDQYNWYDSACRLRSVALARNDSSKGGNAKQFTYVLSDSTTRTINPGANGAAGFGYVVAHLSNPSFAWSYGADDSPLGSGNSATYNKLFVGDHHAIHEYTLNYVRYGLTQYALTNHSIDPWTWINGAGDPNRQYVTVYTMPVRIQWMFATGRDYPIWSVTFDLSAAPDHAIDSDFRAPYGDMKIEGGAGTDLVGGVAWGDSYKFTSAGNPFTMNNDWNYAQLNSGAPYDSLWTSTIDAEMGLAGTQLTVRQNAGGYNNYLAPIWRGKTSATMGQLCLNDEGAGPGYDHKLPCTSDWAYQLIQYSVASASETTDNKRLAWGADWGSLGNSSFTSSNGYAVSGYPKVSYSVYVVLDPHSKNPTQNIAQQAKTISLTTLTATLGTIRTQGSAGVGRADNKPYTPIGYSPIFGTWEVNAANNAVNLWFAVSNSAPAALATPIIVVHNYTSTTSAAQMLLDGTTLTANSDYFMSVRPSALELWVTLNRQITGTHNLQILNSATDVTLNVAKLGTGSGVVSPTVGAHPYSYGALVTPTATANFGSTFTGWSGACSGAGICSIAMTTTKRVTATFTLNNYDLTVAKAGAGSGVVSPAAGVHPYSYGTIVTPTASANPGSTFTGWSGNCSGLGVCVIAMISAKSVTANFVISTATFYTLTITLTGLGGGGVTPSVGTHTYLSGTIVPVTATANLYSRFSGWSGNCSGLGACSVTMTANRSVIANFGQYRLYLPLVLKDF